ncbi:MAG: class I mannose-6-phosphate isomerase [Xanthobacteraceae bacterium]|nr:class I mannose-6-phosphate isomerase [Xanthobacteraceae bacterium]
MTLELAGIRAVRKPWGGADLSPWSPIDAAGSPVGELWFERAETGAAAPALLLKLLFTTEPLSVQVHPGDVFAQSMGLPNGKTEAWYILSAAPDAKIALGLKRALTPVQLRAAIDDGTVSQLVQWRQVAKDDVVFVPAGTIHAIGAGLVLAEIQQRSDTTFRLFDYGRARELHADAAVSVACAGPAGPQPTAKRLSGERTLLMANPHFVVERISLPPRAQWTLRSERETWMLMLEGHARVQAPFSPTRGAFDLDAGQAIFLEADCAAIAAGDDGMTALVAYVGPDPQRVLLEHSGERRDVPGGDQAAGGRLQSSSGRPNASLTATEAAS